MKYSNRIYKNDITIKKTSNSSFFEDISPVKMVALPKAVLVNGGKLLL